MRTHEFARIFIVLILIVVLNLIAIVPERTLAQRDPTDGAAKSPGPLTAREALTAIKVAPGFRIELVASEPQVVDPVAIRFDERGRMWVAEMRDYPHGPKPGEAPRSTIKILEDQDGDGFFETSTVFADKLLFANGLQPWRTGVIATIAGRVVYMPDDDNDKRADRIETWYEGFAQENSQLRANHPTLSIDNRVYVANGLRGGKVVDARDKKAEAVSISGMDFRFDPIDGGYEAVSGVGQFGLTFDDDGRRFVCSNRNPVKHIVLPNQYLRRNPKAPPSQVANDVAIAGADSKLYPLSRAWTTSTLHAGQFTAACGVTIYTGDRVKALHGNVFTCDPTGNLVHREIMKPTGGSFASKPAREGVEFIASPDEWFRPVNLSNGPDGALYLVDMYRAVIEHPQFVPEELKNRPDQRFGEDRGRVYRIVADSAKDRPVDRLDHISLSQLAARLNDANGWTRETAARLLLQQCDSGDRDAISSVLVKQLTAATPRGWARSLWLLDRLGKLSNEMLVEAMAASSAGVQLQALRLAETRAIDGVRAAMRRLAESDDGRVRYQLALSLTPGAADDVEALTSIAVRGAADLWTRQAVALAAGEQIELLAANVLSRLNGSGKEFDQDAISLAEHLLELAARQAPLSVRLRRAVQAVASRNASLPIAYALIRGASRSRVGYGKLKEQDAAFARTLTRVLDTARTVARDVKAPAKLRMTAIGLLSATASAEPDSRGVLVSLARGEQADQTTRIAAINALISAADDEFSAELIGRFRSESPAMRRAILDHTLARSSRIALLLDRIESGEIKIGEIDRVRTNRLLAVKAVALKPRIGKAFANAIPQDRKKVLADYQPVLALKANPNRGELIFRKNCATCHRIGKWGVDVAPDIADSRTRKPAQLLTDILQPNRAIDSNYVSYTVITTDGRSLNAVLDVETSDSITLKLAEGKRVTLARDEIEEMRSNGVSLMPEGLEKNIDPQQMADLISFIKNWRYLDGKTPYTE